MAEGKVLSKVSQGLGDVAVDGLLRGVLAGLAMAGVLIVAGLVAQLPVQVALSRFDPTGGASALAGLLAHLATAAIYGLLFAVLTAPFAERLGNRMVLAGIVFALALWLISRALMASELGAPLRVFPAWGWALAHLVYGAQLGWLMRPRR